MTRVRMATGKEIASARKVLPVDQSLGTLYALVISLTHDQRNTGATSVCYATARARAAESTTFYHPYKHGWERVERQPYSGGLRHGGATVTMTFLYYLTIYLSQPIKPTDVGGNVKALTTTTALSRVLSNEGTMQSVDVCQIV